MLPFPQVLEHDYKLRQRIAAQFRKRLERKIQQMAKNQRSQYTKQLDRLNKQLAKAQTDMNKHLNLAAGLALEIQQIVDDIASIQQEQAEAETEEVDV